MLLRNEISSHHLQHEYSASHFSLVQICDTDYNHRLTLYFWLCPTKTALDLYGLNTAAFSL